MDFSGIDFEWLKPMLYLAAFGAVCAVVLALAGLWWIVSHLAWVA